MTKSGGAFIDQSNFSTKLLSGNYNTAVVAGVCLSSLNLPLALKRYMLIHQIVFLYPIQNATILQKTKENEIFEYNFIKSLAPM